MVDSIDPDAKWLKKGKRYDFGYKGFVSTEGKHGFIQNIVVTAANQYEGSMLEEIISPLSADIVFADKGYAVKNNRKLLSELGIIDGIMRKATRGTPLSKTHKWINKLISKYRFKVEQCFGKLKRRFKFSRASYFNIEKVTGQFYLKAICFNMLKAKNLLLTG